MAAPEQMGGMPAGDIFGDGPIEMVQEFAVLELLGCEAKNRYRIEGAAAGPMFIHEESACCERIFCGPQRSLKLYVHMGPDKESPVILVFDKHFHLQGNLCCCRPKMDIYDPAGNQLGKVHDPCRFCWVDQSVYNNEGVKLFTASGCPCQLGIFCPCLAPVEFPVTNELNGSKDGMIMKKFGGCAECLTGVNRFQLQFPSGSGVNDKSLLLAMTFLLDFQYFEVQKNNN